MERLPDLLRAIRTELEDAIEQARQEGMDAESQDSAYWDIASALEDAYDFVDGAIAKIPEED